MNLTWKDIMRQLDLTLTTDDKHTYQGQVMITFQGKTKCLPYTLITDQDFPQEQAAWHEFLFQGLLQQSLDIAGCFIDFHRGLLDPLRNQPLQIAHPNALALLNELHQKYYDSYDFQGGAFRVWQQAWGSTDREQWGREYALEAGMSNLLGEETLEALWGILLAERSWLINDHPLMIPVAKLWQQSGEELKQRLSASSPLEGNQSAM